MVLVLVAFMAGCGDAGQSIRRAGEPGPGTDEDRSSAGTPSGPLSPTGSPAPAPPSTSTPAPAATKVCTFDSRGFFRVGAEVWESISAYGRFWNFRSNESPVDIAGDLRSVERYISGPCPGSGGAACVFDTRAQFTVGPELWESISAYGKYWNFRPDGSLADGSGSDLTSVPRYASGPCAGKTAGTCVFDTRTQAQIGSELWESISAYGKYWNFRQDGSAVADSGSDLGSVARYAAGPCAGKAAGTCKLDTRTFVTLNGKYLESITAYGRYWNYPSGSDTALEGDSGGDLTAVVRYASICALSR